MPDSSIPTVRIGQLLAERYNIQRLLGEGAVGAVFAAEDLDQCRLVAIKVLKPTAVGDRHALERFRREISATMRIECEHIVRTLGVGYLEDETPFMVMEYLDARDLSKVIADDGPLPFDKAIGFALQLCLALAHAHRVGIVHRDIKPANLLLVRQPNGRELVKVLDFGISKVTPDARLNIPTKLTGNAVRLGSPLYMSPEQRTMGREVDERADIWAIGITLFEMLSGVTPFDSSPQSIRGEWEAPSSVPSLSRHRAGLPQGLDAVIAKCLQRMPASRFQNVAELAAALALYAAPAMARLSWEVAQVLGPPSGAARVGALGAGTTLGPTIAPGPATIRVSTRSLSHRGWLLGICSFGMAAALVLALLLDEQAKSSRVLARAYDPFPVPATWTERAFWGDQKRPFHRAGTMPPATIPIAVATPSVIAIMAAPLPSTMPPAQSATAPSVDPSTDSVPDAGSRASTAPAVAPAVAPAPDLGY